MNTRILVPSWSEGMECGLPYLVSPRFTVLEKLPILTVLSVIDMSGAIPSGKQRLKQKGEDSGFL